MRQETDFWALRNETNIGIREESEQLRLMGSPHIFLLCRWDRTEAMTKLPSIWDPETTGHLSVRNGACKFPFPQSQWPTQWSEASYRASMPLAVLAGTWQSQGQDSRSSRKSLVTTGSRHCARRSHHDGHSPRTGCRTLRRTGLSGKIPGFDWICLWNKN